MIWNSINFVVYCDIFALFLPARQKKVPKFRGLPRNFCPFFACCAKKCLNFAVNYEIFGFKWQQNLRCLASHNQLFRYSGSMRRWRQCAHLYSEFFRHFSDLWKRGQICVASVSIPKISQLTAKFGHFFSKNFAVQHEIWPFFLGFFWVINFDPSFLMQKKKAARLIHITSDLKALNYSIFKNQ